MKQRILSTFALWTTIIGLAVVFREGSVPWLLAIFGVAAQYELHELLGKTGYRPMRLSLVLGFLLPIAVWFVPEHVAATVFPVFLLILLGSVLWHPVGAQGEMTVQPSVFSFLYIPYPFHFYGLLVKSYVIHQQALAGICVVVWAVAVAKFSDVGGLLAGKWFGRNKLAPTISPGKTWEGVVGGMLLSCCLGIGLASIFRSHELFPLKTAATFLAIIAIVAMSVISDLVESAWKRYADVKDSGSCIPGIGGALDLIDSLIFAAPVTYIIFRC
jgi:phosphatidate cytidylyltransferase